MSVIGVDPGLSGALACYDAGSKRLDILDMPIFQMMVGKKKRKRVDAVDLAEYFEMAKASGVELVMIEAVGGRPRQSASGGFVFGYTVGLVYMACVMVRLPIETVTPQVWKKLMRIPGKRELIQADQIKTSAEQEDAIVQRAEELFPEHREKFRGNKGGKKVDRAEAAMLAKYGTDFALRGTKPVRIQDSEWRMIYQNANTGA